MKADMSVNHSISSRIARFALIACFYAVLPLQAAHTKYYVDAAGGNDAAAGTSRSTAWKNLTKVNGTTFGPGDTILLKTGSVWTGSLSPQGSGASGSPNVIDTFGAGAKPIINANGAAASTFSLTNQQYWEVNNLELTNDDNPAVEDNAASRRGVYATASAGVMNHVYIRNCYIHDVDGNADGSKSTGGIIMPISGGAHFNDVLLEGNTIRKVDRTGIEATAGGVAVTTNMVIRNNSIISTGGDAMIVQGCMKALVEYNLADGCCARATSCNAGIWPWASDSTLFQFNEACNTSGGGCDREGFDSDWKCHGSIFQYNYSHENSGGFILVCSPGDAAGEDNYGTVIRYNISQNDGPQTVFYMAGTGSKDTRIYNNTIYVGQSVKTEPIVLDASWNGYAGTTFFWNNIFYALSPVVTFGANALFSYENNCYFTPNVLKPSLDTTRHKNAIIGDPLLVAPGTGGRGVQAVDGYKLLSNSPCINKGLDVRTKGENPDTRDYWNNQIPQGSAFDIGAFEATGPFDPACIIISPVEMQTFPSGSTIAISAKAWDPENKTIAKVEFFQGTAKIGEDVNGADGWSFSWAPAADGVFVLTARATNADGKAGTSAPVRITAGYRNPENPADAVSGSLHYDYYEGAWLQLPRFDSLTPVKTGACAGFVLTMRNRTENFGVRYTGYIKIPADGMYTFYTNSNDGSRLYLGTTLVVDNDGARGGSMERYGMIGCKAGLHEITVDFFQALSSLFLSVSWECTAAGIIKQAIPISALYCVGAAAVQDAFTKAAAGPDLSVSMMGTRAVIRYSPHAMAPIATIRIVNAQGRNMITARAAPHSHEFAFNRNALPAGRYLCVLKAGTYERIAPLAISK